MEKTYSKKLVINTLIFGIGNFSSRVLIFFLIPLYTRTLSSSDYGTIDLLTMMVNFLLPFFTINIHEATIRFCLSKNIDSKEVIKISLNTFLIGFILLTVILYPIISYFNMMTYIFYFLVIYFITALKSIFSYYARGIEKVKTVVTLGIIDSLLLFLTSFIFLFILRYELVGYFYSQILSGTVILVLYIYTLKINIKDIFFIKNKDLRKNMFFYCIPMIPNSISWWLNNTADKYIINFFGGISYTGVYAVAYKVPSLLNTITKIFMDAWQISAVDEYESNNEGSFSEVFNFFFSLNIIVCSLLIIFSKFIGRFMFSKEFYYAVNFVPILLVAYFFNSIASYIGSIYTSSKKTNMLFVSTSTGAIINIVLNIILIPKYLGYGASIATLISFFSIWIIRQINTRKIMILKINYFILFFKILILFFIMIFNTINIKNIFIVNIIFIFILIFTNYQVIISIITFILKKFRIKLKR